MATKYHTRSISLPSRSHPKANKIEIELNRLKTWESSFSSTSTSESIGIGLSGLEELYISLEDVLTNSASVQQLSTTHQTHRCLDEVLDGSMRLLDICEMTRDVLSRFKEQIRSLESSFRRRKLGDSTLENDVKSYTCFRKMMKKEVKKLTETVLKQMAITNQLDHELSPLTRVLREVNSVNFSVFMSLLVFLSASSATSTSNKPRQSKWSLVTKLVHKGSSVASEDQKVNALERVDAALSEGNNLDCEKIHNSLEILEMGIEDLESSLECVFRRLIKTRASILNILSH